MSRYFEERYEIVEEIAEGGEGKILKAYDHAVERFVAIKEVSEIKKKKSEALREARAIARISHPNVVSLYDVIEEDGRIYLVMEYVEGVSLRELLDELHALPFQAALGIFLQLASAVEFAHSHGILHLDIKPENVLINSSGTVKLTDFGIAQFIVEAQETDRIMGTTHYLAPEALKGKYSPRSDIFALGVVLYEMLAGENPFFSYEPRESYKKILELEPVPISRLRKDIPKEFDEILKKALEKSYIKRYKDVTTFRIKVERFFEYESREEPVRELFEEERETRKPHVVRKALVFTADRVLLALSPGLLAFTFAAVGSNSPLTGVFAFLPVFLIGLLSPALATFLSFLTASYFLFLNSFLNSLISIFFGIVSFLLVRDFSKNSAFTGYSISGTLLMLESFALSFSAARKTIVNLISMVVIYASGIFTIHLLQQKPHSFWLLRNLRSLNDVAFFIIIPALCAFLSYIISKVVRENLIQFSHSISIFLIAVSAFVFAKTSMIPTWVFERLSVSLLAALIYGFVRSFNRKTSSSL